MTSTDEYPGIWRKASYSETSTSCVEVARTSDLTQLRDSKTAFGAANDGRLTVSAEQFDAFLRVVRS